MTVPTGEVNEGANYVWGTGSNFGQGTSEDSWLSVITGGVKGSYQGAQDSWRGKYSEWAEVASELEDGQLELNERADLLDGVRGYCSMYMSHNWSVPQNTYKALPFNMQLGPNKGAEPLGEGAAIRFLEPGLWRSDLHVSFGPATGWLGIPITAQVYLTVHQLGTGNLLSQSRYDLVITANGAETAAFSKTIVIPGNDYYIYAAVAHQRNQSNMVYGGTLRSAFSVNKWDSRTDNAGVADYVPDGGSL